MSTTTNEDVTKRIKKLQQEKGMLDDVKKKVLGLKKKIRKAGDMGMVKKWRDKLMSG